MGAQMAKRGGGGGRRRRRGQAAAMSEINVTPFVDVMLVLLIIFMVAAPLLSSGVPVQLPETAAGALPQDEERPLTLTMTAEGEVLVQDTAIDRNSLIPRMRAIAAERTSNAVFLRADGTIPYEQVAQIMGALNSAGFTQINLVTSGDGPTLDSAGGE
ncbi:ExbD/TolR family protein [Pontivivens insulae]|uniref:Biopolymer transport protein ExbD n=1 Tax=Pontivivens insulae TaxID=1639689 RepID=A0A2R8A8M7_9RHOB|nr:ExbD/TolR family protein [Pontivivens insulae]RED18683.1 cell division and transport-associated protein TolR [Pontivivens insulae]SPF28581.1 Biopolymer transport protein ExbD [Pontivivens insulae]